MAKKKLISAAAAFFAAVSLVSFSPEAAAADIEELVPMGCTIGIEIKTDGVVVVGTSDVITADGNAAPAEDAGFRCGDVIREVNGVKVESGEDFSKELSKHAGNAMTMTVFRDGESKTLSVKPALNKNGKYEIGLKLRDGMAGIGTVTFYDPETGLFGALGHPVNDIDSGIIMPLREGTVTESEISDVIAGEAGDPGQLVGTFSDAKVIGTIFQNGTCGIFGILNSDEEIDSDEIPVCGEIEIGPAVIMSNVSGTEVCEYDVEIVRVYGERENDVRSMMVKVTDPELIEKTGGIVQGMSGSPIIQNGKLVGAVTHVLVADPLKGYGIGIQKMIDASGLNAA